MINLELHLDHQGCPGKDDPTGSPGSEQNEERTMKPGNQIHHCDEIGSES